jgi:hypothetical protein
MKFVLGTLVAAFLLTTAPARAQNAEKVTNAEAAALAWLALTDVGNYSRSWDLAASIFQLSISKQNWMDVLQNVRKPLGNLVSRKVKSARYAESLPGAPDGESVVIQYDTQFENKKSAMETVTPHLEKDGSWKVSGYYIR